MSISSRFAVGVHILTSLASAPDSVVSSDTLAGSVNTHPVVVRRHIGALQQAGLVTVQHGKYGGARLARPPSEITLLDVYRAMEEPQLFALHQQPPKQGDLMGASIFEVLGDVCEDAKLAMETNLARVTIAHVLQRTMARRQQNLVDVNNVS